MERDAIEEILDVFNDSQKRWHVVAWTHKFLRWRFITCLLFDIFPWRLFVLCVCALLAFDLLSSFFFHSFNLHFYLFLRSWSLVQIFNSELVSFSNLPTRSWSLAQVFELRVFSYLDLASALLKVGSTVEIFLLLLEFDKLPSDLPRSGTGTSLLRSILDLFSFAHNLSQRARHSHLCHGPQRLLNGLQAA